MPQPAISNSIKQELVFYVREPANEDMEIDEFTFYLERDDNDTVVKALANAEGHLTDARTEAPGKRTFSFAERVLIKNLVLTKESLDKPSEEFWKKLQTQEPNSPYAYLGSKFQGGEKPGEKQLATILNRIIENENLAGDHAWASEADLGDGAKFLQTITDPRSRTQWQNRLILERIFDDLIRKTLPGRGLVCYSYVGRYLSVTFRRMSEDEGYGARDFRDKEKRKKDLFSLNEYCRLLYKEIFEKTDSTEHAHGLLVITGSTKSAKSEIARGLIQLYLDGKTTSGRRHHLVTFEDPVERFYAHAEAKGCFPWAAVEHGTKADSRDYTPRQKEKDAHLLDEALNDALRQTPALFFVGETRHREEWKVLLNFAATGHLIVTTAHAGSLVEAMHKIFEALDVTTAADRSEIAGKLLGVIHLRRYDLELSEEAAAGQKWPSTLLPGLWRRTPRGIAALTSDGLSSLLPYRPKKNGDVKSEATAETGEAVKKETAGKASKKDRNADATSCLGRRWIVEELIRPEQTSEQIESVFGKDLSDSLKKQAYAKATEWDLLGV
jgi:hypothetical protein